MSETFEINQVNGFVAKPSTSSLRQFCIEDSSLAITAASESAGGCSDRVCQEKTQIWGPRN